MAQALIVAENASAMDSESSNLGTTTDANAKLVITDAQSIATNLASGLADNSTMTKHFDGIAESNSVRMLRVGNAETANDVSHNVHQVAFTLTTYTLLQWHLCQQERQALNKKTQPRVRETLLPTAEQVVIYHGNYFALLDVYEHQELLLTLSETARAKVLARTRQLRAAMLHIPAPRRRPP